MYDRILVATDGSEPAQAAVRHAVGLAAATDATLAALYVVDTETSWLTVSKADVKQTLRRVGERAGENVLADVAARASDGRVPVETALREGVPDEEILVCADEIGADIVVLGTHGRNGVSRRLLGSTTERVARDANTPVLTVHTDDGPRVTTQCE
ncbi:universal stress protein [Salarchaeum sp. JOR-1]|uniref:universal stress protein n=1 Tax=Salarchaeum sp. JOR-1 TaxID=2599399 RepID=UPI00119840E8|nr:universal stress protein [Salarchaeum sp. JOR-1]QDX39420.1 universal stress protein [Salarchaeum sp. JOR-1]